MSSPFSIDASTKKGFSAVPPYDFARRPVQFIPNGGQLDPKIRYYELGPNHATYFSSDSVYQIVRLPDANADAQAHQQARVRLSFPGMNPGARLETETRLGARVNYYSGRETSRNKTRVTGLPTYGSVWYRSVYPGVDIRFHGDQRVLEYDVHIAPGGSPDDVVMRYEGARSLSVTAAGQLAIDLGDGRILQDAPFAYQVVAGKRVRIPVSYRIDRTKGDGGRIYGFELAHYDRSLPVVIDPTVVSSSYLGGSEDDTANGVATDAAGNVYITGTTWSTDFPVQSALKSAAQAEYRDVFVSKFDASGALVYSTYLGGGNVEDGKAIAVDSGGNVYVTGSTMSQDFPVTAQAYQSLGDGVFSDAFVVKIDPLGGLSYSTYLGGSLDDEGNAIVVDETGAGVTVVVTGETWSHDFPTVNPLYTVAVTGNNRDAFVARLDLGQSGAASMVWSTYLGGGNRDSGAGIALDGTGNVYVVGTTESSDFPVTANGYEDPFVLGFSRVFLARLGANGASLQYSACLGGDGEDVGRGVAVDATGNAYIAGSTHSTNFPTVNPLYTVANTGDNLDAFVTRIDTNVAGLGGIIYSTYLGGAGNDAASAIAIDLSGNAYVTGYTRSTDFPVVGTSTAPMNALQGDEDGFVVKLNPVGSSVLYSVYFGGTNEDYIRAVTVMNGGDVLLVGQTRSPDFPMLNPYQSTLANGNRSAFLVRIQ
ncbi:MAG: hypothetical protein GC138_07985 [Gammaproteobacteria bacterium]|nr:hypothetical protein [Gammaproteobacteria bacterium]